MAFDEETLKGILSNGETSVEDKIRSLIGEHESDITSLKQKNGEIIGNEKKLKEQLKAEQDKAAEAAKRAASLEEELKKNSPEENRKMYEARLSEVETKHKVSLAEITKDRDTLRESHFTRLRNDAINESIKDMRFVDGLKDGFVARVMAMHKFEPKDIENNGEYKFYDSGTMKDIGSVIHEFSLTKEGKAYIQNTATGGGALGSTGTPQGGGTTITRERFNAMSQVDRIEFFGKGGTIAS
jgi:hypothetical protein